MGEVFHTLSDSEVLLHSYMVWGADCLSRLRGMFAFLIWDEREKVLFAARDRFGIKPLYISRATTVSPSPPRSSSSRDCAAGPVG